MPWLSQKAVLPGTLDLARAAGGFVPSPMRHPAANCRYMSSIRTATERVGHDAPRFLTSDVDHVRGTAVFAETACAVGPGLRDYEIIGLATAELAYESDQASTVVMCPAKKGLKGFRDLNEVLLYPAHAPGARGDVGAALGGQALCDVPELRGDVAGQLPPGRGSWYTNSGHGRPNII